MPANRKPRDQLQVRRPERMRTVELVDPSTPVPKAPSRWLVATRRRWDAFWGSEVADAAIFVDRVTVVYRLFCYYDQWERLRRVVAAEPIVDGSKGQPRMNPAAGQLNKLEGHIQRLEQTLGIGPLARHRLGLTVGQARLTALQLNALAMGDVDDET